MTEIKVYGAPWCPDCRRTKTFFGEHRVAYDWIDIDQDEEALRYVEELQGGGRTIPTVVFGDGSARRREPVGGTEAGKFQGPKSAARELTHEPHEG